jgi:hypothetical protein
VAFIALRVTTKGPEGGVEDARQDLSCTAPLSTHITMQRRELKGKELQLCRGGCVFTKLQPENV